MGINKKNKTKNQMRFFTVATAALLATCEAVKISQVQVPEESSLVSVMATTTAAHAWDLQEVFEAVDANGDGSLTMKEIATAIKAYAKEHGYTLPEGWRKHVKAIFDHVDADKNGKVTMDEIHAAI